MKDQTSFSDIRKYLYNDLCYDIDRVTLCTQIFLVRKSPDQKAMVLSVRVSNQQEELQVQDILVKEEKSCEYPN